MPLRRAAEPLSNEPSHTMQGHDYYLTIASRPPLTKLHPDVAQFFKEYLLGEKAVSFNDQLVLNTQFPPYPSRAFEGMATQLLMRNEERRLYSVTWAVTNRCGFACWHCYNAGRNQRDVPLAIMPQVAASLQDLGAVMVTLTGGEPLLRDDLEAICSFFDHRSCLNVGTTGWGLTPRRARALRQSGVFSVGISLDSDNAADHDRMRGKSGAFRAAVDAIAVARDAGLYAYVVSVATREFLHPDRFWPFMSLAGRIGALEVHLLEPCPIGRLAGRQDVVLSGAERRQIIEYQRTVAGDETLPVLSTFAYLEHRDAFGCGAGVTHLYIDGSGEVCPCNLVPMSFGNIGREPLRDILTRMGCRFRQSRCVCVGRTLAPRFGQGPLPTPQQVSERICEDRLPASHPLPRFEQVRAKARGSAGEKELARAYNQVAADYETSWLACAGEAVRLLVRRLHLRGAEKIFEAGCGTGFGSALLAAKLNARGHLTAVDISEGMLAIARQRLLGLNLRNVEFGLGDALDALAREHDLGVVFTTWVLGYMPLRPFFIAAAKALTASGRLALVVHKEGSPNREWTTFAEIIARDPSLLQKRIAFDFPRGPDHLRDELAAAGLKPLRLWEATAVFRYRSAQEVLEHLLKSGAGTVFYNAIDPLRRDKATEQFLELLKLRHHGRRGYEVRHDYLACIAAKSDAAASNGN